MKCKGCKWGTPIHEKLIFCLIPGDGCWKDDKVGLKRKKHDKKARSRDLGGEQVFAQKRI